MQSSPSASQVYSTPGSCCFCLHNWDLSDNELTHRDFLLVGNRWFLLTLGFFRQSISSHIGDNRGRFVIKRFFFGVEGDASYSSNSSENVSNMVSSTSFSLKFSLACEKSMDGTAFCLVTATMGTKFSTLHSITFLPILIIWEFLLSATDENNQVHCIVFPTIARTVKLPPTVPCLRVSETTMTFAVPMSTILLVSVDYVHSFFGEYRQAVRSILRFCRDVTSEEVCSVDFHVVSFRLEELFVKFVCCTSFHTGDLWSHGASGDLPFIPHVWISSEMEICLYMLLCPNSDVRIWYFSVFWRKFPFERKNALHGHFGLSHLLKVSLCIQVVVLGRVELQELSWRFPRTVICNIHKRNRYIFFVGLFCFAFLFSLRTGRSLLLLWGNDWTILSYLTFFLT